MLPDWFYTWSKKIYINHSSAVRNNKKQKSKKTNNLKTLVSSEAIILSHGDITLLSQNMKLRPVQPGSLPRPRLCCTAHAHNHSRAHADASVASTVTHVLPVPPLFSASVPLAVRSSPGRTVWRAEAGWNCPLRSPSLSGSKPSGSNLSTLPLEGIARLWLIPPGIVQASGTKKGKPHPPTCTSGAILRSDC